MKSADIFGEHILLLGELEDFAPIILAIIFVSIDRFLRALIVDTLISSASLISSSDSVISMGCFISSRVD